MTVFRPHLVLGDNNYPFTGALPIKEKNLGISPNHYFVVYIRTKIRVQRQLELSKLCLQDAGWQGVDRGNPQ